MAYVLRVYTGDRLVEAELEAGRPYRVGGSPKAEVAVPELGADLLVSVQAGGWTAESGGRRGRAGEQRQWEDVLVLDEENRTALTVYTADFALKCSDAALKKPSSFKKSLPNTGLTIDIASFPALLCHYIKES